MAYQHTHTAPLASLIFGALGLLTLVIGVAGTGWLVPVGVALLVGGLIAFALSALTVTVSEDAVGLAFRFGLPKKQLPLGDVLRAEPVRNRWWYGWGIRWIPRGQLWNVWGLDAVELRLADDRRFRIGTDDPQALVAAIAEAQGSAAGVDGCWGV